MATTSQEYTIERKTGTNTSEEVQIPATSVTGLATVATSGSYNDLGDKPTMPDNSKHGYTELTNENLNTITEVGWYCASSGNTCTNRPSVIGSNSFVLVVEKSSDAYIKQTIYMTGISAAAYYVSNVRYSSNSGSSWYGWYKQQTLSDGYTQTFSARKTFSDGIGISNSLQFGSDAGSSSQFAMSQGSSSAPKWVNLQVKVNGTTYTADSSGLIDLGEISGGTSAVSAYNDIY